MIQKVNYRDQVRMHILERMFAGDLRPNDALSLAELGRELGVSVTPIREALSQLQYSRIVQAIPNRGFIIPQLDDREEEHLYLLIATLEQMVVAHSQFTEVHLTELEAANQAFIAAKNPLDRINNDFHFHTVLTSGSDNEYARQLITDLKTRVFFYELAFMEAPEYSGLSVGQHEAIIRALRNGRLHEAATLTRANWLVTIRDYKNRGETTPATDRAGSRKG